MKDAARCAPESERYSGRAHASRQGLEEEAPAFPLLPWFAASVMLAFGVLLCVYFALRSLHLAEFIASQRRLDVGGALGGGLLLMGGTALASWGVVEHRRGDSRRAAWVARGMVLVALGFMAVRVRELVVFLEPGGLHSPALDPGHRIFLSLQVIMAGAHALCVGGSAVSLLPLAIATRGIPTHWRMERWEIATYWWYHFWLIWLVHYSLLYVLK